MDNKENGHVLCFVAALDNSLHLLASANREHQLW